MDRQTLASIVKRIMKENLSKIPVEIMEKFNVQIVNKEHSYFYYYQRRLEEIEENEIDGELDIFIEAACICEALLVWKGVSFNLAQYVPPELALINYYIAFEVACEVIKSPYTYLENNGTWLRVEKDSVEKITVPTGIIPNDTLKERIVTTMAREQSLHKYPFSVMQFSNLLHMIYLYNV